MGLQSYYDNTSDALNLLVVEGSSLLNYCLPEGTPHPKPDINNFVFSVVVPLLGITGFVNSGIIYIVIILPSGLTLCYCFDMFPSH